jgi:hypothetical protein
MLFVHFVYIDAMCPVKKGADGDTKRRWMAL